MRCRTDSKTAKPWTAEDGGHMGAHHQRRQDRNPREHRPLLRSLQFKQRNQKAVRLAELGVLQEKRDKQGNCGGRGEKGFEEKGMIIIFGKG